MGLLFAPAYLMWGPSNALPASSVVEPPTSEASAAEAVRGMARFLESAPPDALRSLAGASADAVEGGAGAPALAQGRAQQTPPVDATEAGLSKVDETERRIAQHYPQTESGALIRRFVALALSDVDTDYRPDLSRVRALNDLMQNAGGAASDLQAALGALRPEEPGFEAERAALIQLASHVGSNEAALPAVESILAAEISRKASLEESADEARLLKLVDSYTMLVTDPRKQADFVRAGIQAQEDSRLRRALEGVLDNLKLLPLSGTSEENTRV